RRRRRCGCRRRWTDFRGTSRKTSSVCKVRISLGSSAESCWVPRKTRGASKVRILHEKSADTPGPTEKTRPGVCEGRRRPRTSGARSRMDLEFQQLDLRYEELRGRSLAGERRLLSSLAEIGQQAPIVVVAGSLEAPARHVVIDGYKRVRLLRRLGQDTVRA